jgi:hypothetical protein
MYMCLEVLALHLQFVRLQMHLIITIWWVKNLKIDFLWDLVYTNWLCCNQSTQKYEDYIVFWRTKLNMKFKILVFK